MRELQLFAVICSHALGLQYPIKLDIVDGLLQTPVGPKDWEGVYWEEDLFHVIAIRQSTSRGLLETIAHEVAHAACVEQHPGAKDHGRSFILACRRLRRQLLGSGFVIGPLYLKGVDL